MTQLKMVKRHRFPLETIQYAGWLYHQFNLSHRDIKDMEVFGEVQITF